MPNETLTALGPLFGPNFITVQVNDDTGKLFQLEVFPDANNPLLRANHLPTHYYFMPQRVYLAKKQDFPTDFDFGATIFKGLMTTETTVGVTDAMTSSGAVSEGGGICSFATTFAIPENVISKAIQMLKKRDYPQPSGFAKFAHLFELNAGDLTPELGIVPILENDVTVEVPALSGVGDAKAPFFIDAQGKGKGSIEATSISAFLVTMNMLAAGAIVGSLKKGVSPFTVHYNLKQQFYLNACDIHMDIDVDKVFDQFSAAVSTGGFLGITSGDLSYNYQKCVTSGAIKTIIRMQGADVPDDLKKMIEQQIQDMQTRAYDLVKKEIFDWTPTPDAPASTNRGPFSSIFGGTSVSLKANHQRKGIHLTQDFQIDTTVSKLDTVSGDLSDLEPAIKANLDKYLAIVDIGESFKKIQLAVTNNVAWSEKLPDGTDLSDPITSVQVQASYPDLSNPLGSEGKPNLVTQAQGFHYTIGHKDPSRAGELAVWTKDNPNDVINIAFLRLDKPIPQWDPDQLRVRKTVVFNSSDPRVDLSGNVSTFTKEVTGKDHAPVITRDEVGYVFVRAALDRPLPANNISVTLNFSIGDRHDTLVVTQANQKNAIWEIFSDKYFDAKSFTYSVEVEVTGPNFTDDPVQYSTGPVSVPLPAGRIKYMNPLFVPLPKPSAEQVEVINSYIKATLALRAVA